VTPGKEETADQERALQRVHTPISTGKQHDAPAPSNSMTQMIRVAAKRGGFGG
jgi:hypothetical protein